MSADISRRREFIVAIWAKGRRCQRELRQIPAKSHEEAVAVIAATRELVEAGAVYEVWPATEPGSILRITLEHREPRRPLPG